MAKFLEGLFNDYLQEQLDEDVISSSPVPPTTGGIYFGSLKSLSESEANRPLYFVIVDKIDNEVYEVLKVSDRHEFATNSDIILDIGTMKIIIETDNNFYLKEDEISKFISIHQLPEDQLKDILTFRDGDVLEGLQTGYTPLSEDDVRNKFKQEEFNQIKEYHTRIFEILAGDETKEEKVRVYVIQSLSQICSLITAKVQISYIDDSRIINEWFKGNEIIETDDEAVSLEDGEVAICPDPVKGGFYLIEPL